MAFAVGAMREQGTYILQQSETTQVVCGPAGASQDCSDRFGLKVAPRLWYPSNIRRSSGCCYR
jgi:hypothetical protein